MKIAVIGTGYAGLVTGACFSETGVEVSCMDVDGQKIEQLNQGKSPIYEPGLEVMIQKNIRKNRLGFTTDLSVSLDKADAIFIAVGTPRDEDGSADLKYVLHVAAEIGKIIDQYILVITKSTVPTGTAEKVRTKIASVLNNRNLSISFDVASNPEFLKEGSAIEDFMKPDRIIIGVDSNRAEKIMKRLYNPFLLNGHPLIFMDIPSAEMTKYAANAMLASRISLMNEFAGLCERTGADINQVRIGIGSDPRIGNKFLYAGAGYGGSCFPKDVNALIKTGISYDCPMDILQAVDKVNNQQKTLIFEKLIGHFKGYITNKTFALWGLSFKPNTDDMREAPSLAIIDKLLSCGARIKAYDPVAMHAAKKILGDAIEFTRDAYEALIDAEALVLVTEWPEFRVPNYKIMSKLMKNRLIFDGRNIYKTEEMNEFGFEYYGIGQPKK